MNYVPYEYLIFLRTTCLFYRRVEQVYNPGMRVPSLFAWVWPSPLQQGKQHGLADRGTQCPASVGIHFMVADK